MKIAIIGGYGHHHLQKAVSSGEIELVGIAADGFDDRAKKFLKGTKAPWFDDYRKMLDTVKADVISVGPVYGYTGEAIAEALGRGFKVTTDKPVGPDWNQFRAVEAEVAHGGRVLITELMERCDPHFRAAHLAVKKGLIGEPVLATAQKSYKFGTRPEFYKDRKLFTGSIMWIGTKAVDVAWYVSGVDFAGVGGHQGNLSRPDYGTMEDHVSAMYALQNGGTCVFHSDYLRPKGARTHADDRVRVAGTKGLVECMAGKCMLITHDDKPQDITDWGKEANPTQDLIDALSGKTDHFSTEKSMYMAKVMLISRDAVDNGQTMEIS